MSMEGASRQAWTQLLASMDPVTDDASADLRALAGELYGVSELLAHNTQVSVALGDRSRDAWPKRELARRLLGGRISEGAMSIVEAAVSQVWRIDRDLTHALERCGHNLVLAAAQRDGNLDAVESQLSEIATTFAQDEDVRDFFRRQDVTAKAKAEFVVKVISGKVLPDTQWLAQRPVRNPRGRSYSAVVWQILALAAYRRAKVTALVSSAIELDQSQIDRLAAGLTRIYGREIFVRATVDPTLSGGVHIRVGDEVIDATIDRRLAEAERSFAG